MTTCLPHAVSLCRVPLAFVLVVTYRAEPMPAIIGLTVFALVAISDKLDGYLARRFRTASYEGYLIDGFADRTFSAACILVAAVHHGLALWVVLMAMTRELLMYTCRLMSPSTWHPPSKATRAHSMLVFSVTRAWFLALMLTVLWGWLRDSNVVRATDIINSVFGLAVLISLLSIGDTLLRGMARDA